jgi:hypothetical protein
MVIHQNFMGKNSDADWKRHLSVFSARRGGERVNLVSICASHMSTTIGKTEPGLISKQHMTHL